MITRIFQAKRWLFFIKINLVFIPSPSSYFSSPLFYHKWAHVCSKFIRWDYLETINYFTANRVFSQICRRDFSKNISKSMPFSQNFKQISSFLRKMNCSINCCTLLTLSIKWRQFYFKRKYFIENIAFFIIIFIGRL